MIAHGSAQSHETLFDCLKRLFPLARRRPDGGNGLPYIAFPKLDGRYPAAYETPPVLPPDIFAAAGYALQYSGAYHHVIAHVASRPARPALQVEVTPEFIAEARATAAAWRLFNPLEHYSSKKPKIFADWIGRRDGEPLRRLHQAWTAVWKNAGAVPIFSEYKSSTPPPPWWSEALFLFIAADEAARNMGFAEYSQIEQASPTGQQPWFFAPVNEIFFDIARRATEKPSTKSSAARGGAPFLQHSPISSFSGASQDVVCVLPKARTAAVGCTLRSLSHHLALLPPRSIARAGWLPYLLSEAPPDERHMNLLLIPFPYTIPASAFQPQPGYAGEGAKRWGFFNLEQTWLKRVSTATLVDFVKQLAAAAKTEADVVHGIVFPELALDEDTWNQLCESLPQALPDLEFIIAGVSGDGSRHGNFVSVAAFQRSAGPGSTGDDRSQKIGFLSKREKHHRWTLDRDEVLSYGLEGRLSPSILWSEDIDLLSRRVDFAVVRQSSVISAMICEDLARVDPCQELIRAIGSSIIFALLMDAPQLKARWPARYATVLAEDPGCAVLTLTSRGLMTRQHQIGKYRSKGPKDRVIALWRDDDRTDPIEISCPSDAQAVRLTLSGVPVVDRTLDGREDRSAVAWRYANHVSVRLDHVEENFRDVLGEDDLAVRREDPDK